MARRTRLFFDRLFLPEGWAEDVELCVADGLITQIAPGASPDGTSERHAIGLPGILNLHSHAFQRGMAGLAERRGPSSDSFWTWREVMYHFVDGVSPEHLRAIAALAYMEMLETGFTRVGEFHYLHHAPDGSPFADPAEMSGAIVEAASETGIALTHLPVFYAHSGFGGAAPTDVQRRFLHDIDSYARLLEALRPLVVRLPDGVLGIAPHSLRAVTPVQLDLLTQLAPTGPVHIHIAEQVREVEDCLAWSGQRPVQWLLDHAQVDVRWCLVHATHMTEAETIAMARSGAIAGLCPITEANLGDGIFPAAAFLEAGGQFGLGSDCNVLIDATEEMRLMEYGQRLARQGRNLFASARQAHSGAAIFASALSGGAAALGVPAGLAIGQAADIVSLDQGHPSLAGRSGDACLDSLVFASGRAGIDCVWRRGEKLVSNGRHRSREPILARYRQTMGQLMP
ncbi:formiminoglutamate deiminase [Novosphingobium sp. Rr 2-17]|uniref:formimidoylglutamate deiminase n=1 Tax=Novosphingobium sp. Rr 2-17 TaxID=555793 RepID=UPI0002697E8C|nr:formimidoylglutamate deiminase [Novosphingobium sp. Rr 2-17]EIZ80104.1 formiminoglutamate deiminase [Novosphingobium sp. Rr 2-17]